MPEARAKDGRNRGARGVRRALFGALVELAFPALMLLQPGPAFSASDPTVREGAAASDDAPAAVSAASFNLSEVRAMRFREDRNAPAQSFTADGPPEGARASRRRARPLLTEGPGDRQGLLERSPPARATSSSRSRRRARTRRTCAHSGRSPKG